MVSFPNCKINLGLRVTRKRADGYHDLETVFYPVMLKDALEIIRDAGEGVAFSSSGLPISGHSEDNLCVKAWTLLKNDFPTLPPIAMHLHKAIPMGAGLGGGSSNGAFALKMLNKLFQLNISQARLEQYALQLGSDCPFFIRNKPCLATGRGEMMEEIEIDLSAYRIALVNPSIHVSTADAFRGVVPTQPIVPLSEIITKDPSSWKELLHNDFEPSVFSKFPQIAAIKTRLYEHGAVYASMTGSGSTVYGLFPSTAQLPLEIKGFAVLSCER
jgi:4-diphosphocytidyl-2-C-methyl-D-erythritol kinase